MLILGCPWCFHCGWPQHRAEWSHHAPHPVPRRGSQIQAGGTSHSGRQRSPGLGAPGLEPGFCVSRGAAKLLSGALGDFLFVQITRGVVRIGGGKHLAAARKIQQGSGRSPVAFPPRVGLRKELQGETGPGLALAVHGAGRSCSSEPHRHPEKGQRASAEDSWLHPHSVLSRESQGSRCREVHSACGAPNPLESTGGMGHRSADNQQRHRGKSRLRVT